MGERPRQGGFTLIELLVVIIILGILAAVVVFAVGGVGDKGQAAAYATDLDTLRTAQEAHCANNGEYAESEAELVAAGLLAEESTIHDIEFQGEGSCGDTGYYLVSNLGYGGAAGLPDDQQFMSVAYRGDPWTTDKKRFARFALDTNVNETLTKLGNDYAVNPRLATSWELINPGNNSAYPGNPTWRFRLRPGVMFHNGTPLEAMDVKYSMDRLVSLNDDFTAKLGSSSSVVVDALTVDITPATANFRLPEILVHPTYAILAEGTGLPTTGTPTTATIVGTGPFKFKSYTASDRVVVERFDDYWGVNARLRELTFRFISDNTARRLALESGDVDAMYDVGRLQVAGLRANTGIQVVTAPISYAFNVYMNLNGTDPLYNETTSLAVRQALTMAINRQDFIDDNWEPGVANLINTPFPPSVLGPYASTITGPTFDQAASRTSLANDGWVCVGSLAPACNPNEIRQKSGEVLDLFMLSQTGNQDDPLLQDLKGRLAEVGIQMTIGSTLTSSQRQTRKNEGNWDLDHVNPNQNDANPAFLLTLQWWSQSTNRWVSCIVGPMPCGPWQQAGPAFDALIAQALASPTFDGTQDFSAQATDLLIDQDHKAIALAGLSRVYGLRNGVAGFEPPHPAESHLLWTGAYITSP
ncbi:MAG: ABC transporter substrate-binding protein [Acidimicrobiales bacterium]